MRNKAIGYTYTRTILNSIEIYSNIMYARLQVKNKNGAKLSRLFDFAISSISVG